MKATHGDICIALQLGQLEKAKALTLDYCTNKYGGVDQGLVERVRKTFKHFYPNHDLHLLG